MSFKPGQVVAIEGAQFQIQAINRDGKMIVRPLHVKEGLEDMMRRLGPTTVTAESEEPPRP